VEEAILRQLIFILLLAILILPACSGTSTPAADVSARATITPLPFRPTPNAAELEVSDPKKTIEAAVGADFTITLRTNPPSGYHWELAEALDPQVIEFVWKDFIPNQKGATDSSGRDIWRFKALAPGETKIVLGYYMGMTEDAAEILTFTVVVK
jgi:predicted secreted protein